MLKNILITIIAGMILWFAQNYFRETPQATYSISEPIEIPGSNGLAEYAQEINVTNSGRGTVKDIFIRVQRHINSYKLTKHTSLQAEVTGSDPRNFELMYPELPVGKKFTLLIRYSQEPIEKKWISISHAAGPAINQENDVYKFGIASLWTAFFLGIFASSLSEIVKIKRVAYTKWADHMTVYRDDKPWFFLTNEWSSVQFQILLDRLHAYSYSEITQQESYQLLNREKPKQLSDDDWKKLCDEASKMLLISLNKETASYNSIGKLIDLYKISKPKHFSLDSWDKFQKSIDNEIENKLLPKYVRDEVILNLLIHADSQLYGLPESIKFKIIENAQHLYCNNLLDKTQAMAQDNRVGFLQAARLDLLTTNQRTQISKFAAQLLRMQEMPKIWSAKEIADFVSRGKPGWMSEEEFRALEKYEKEATLLQNKIEENQNERVALTSVRSKMEITTNQALSQLRVIDNILNNPDAIEKIESYEETFSPGNFKNLKRVAQLLRTEH